MSYSILNSPQGNVTLELDKSYIDALTNPTYLINELSTWVENLTLLTGHFPGTHPDRANNPTKLTFRQAGISDPDFTKNEIAIWNPVEAVIKLNLAYLDDLVKAFNTSPYVIELIEPIGLAALAYQSKDPYTLSEESAQVIGRGPFYYGIARAVGFYGLTTAPVVSSIYRPELRLSVNEVTGLELVRCYRKQRLGFSGNELLYLEGFSTEPDPDISYGFLLELATVFADWGGLREVLSIDVPKIYSESYAVKDFARNYLQEYNDFIFNLSLRYKLNLSGLLNSWGFITNFILDGLPESFPVISANQPITVSERLLSKIDPNVISREVNAQYLPSIVLGGFDTFGLTVSSGSVLVLTDTKPNDNKSFKDLNCTLLGTPESNGPIVKYKVPYNLGDIAPRGHTLLVPEYEGPPSGSPLFEHFNSSIKAQQSIVVAKVIYLGTIQKYFPTIIKWSPTEDNSAFVFNPSNSQDVPVDTYAVLSKTKFGYDYIFNNNTAICQMISIDSVPTDSYQDDDDIPVYVPGGTALSTKSVTIYRESTGLTSKEFTEKVVIKNSSNVVITTFDNIIPRETEPNLWVARERLPSNFRQSNNIFEVIGHPVITEKVVFGTYLLASSLAVDAKLSYRESNKDIVDNAKKQYIAALPPSVQVVNIPIDFANKVKEILKSNIGNTSTEIINYKFNKLIEAYDTLLSQDIKEQLKNVNNQSNYTVPQLYGLNIQYPPETQIFPDVVKSGSVENTLVGLAKTQSSLPLSVRLQSVVDISEQTNTDIKTLTNYNIQSLSTQNADRNSVTNKSNGFVRFIGDGFSGLFETGGDPRNPWSVLNGSYFNNLVYLFENKPGEFLPVFNSKANPRASAKLITGLVEASLVALKVDPAVASSVNNNLANVISQLGNMDKPSTSMAWQQAGSSVLQTILNTYFPGEQAKAYPAISDWVSSKLAGWANGEYGPVNTFTDVIDSASTAHKEPQPKLDPGPTVKSAPPPPPNPPGTPPPPPAYKPVFRKYASGIEGDLQESIDYAGVIVGINRSYGVEQLAPELQGFVKYSLGETNTVIPLYTDAQNPRLRIDINNNPIVRKLTTEALDELSVRYLHDPRKTFQDVNNLRDNLIDNKIAQASAARLHASLINTAIIGAANKAYSIEGFEKAKSILEGFSTGRINRRSTGRVVPLLTNKKITDAVAAYKADLDSGASIVGSTYEGYPVQILNTYIELESRDEKEKYNKANPVISGKNIFTINYENAASKVIPRAKDLSDLNMTSVAQIKSLTGSPLYTFEIMPAIKSYSNSSNQGMQPPGAGHGISWKSSLNVAKLNVPGGKPIYQVMGINEEVIEFVGSFLGMRNEQEQNLRHDSSQFEDLPISYGATYNTSQQYYRAQQESNIVRAIQLSGEMIQLTIKSYAGTQSNDEDQGIAINVKGYIQQFQRFIKSDDRVWYQISFRVTDHSINKPSKPAIPFGTPRKPELPAAITIPGDGKAIYTGSFGRTISGVNPPGVVNPSRVTFISVDGTQTDVPIIGLKRPNEIKPPPFIVLDKNAFIRNLSTLIDRWNATVPAVDSKLFNNYSPLSNTFIDRIRSSMRSWENKINNYDYGFGVDTVYFTNIHKIKVYNYFASNTAELRTYATKVRSYIGFLKGTNTVPPNLEADKNTLAVEFETIADSLDQLAKLNSMGLAELFLQDPSGFIIYIEDIEKYVPTNSADNTPEFLAKRNQILAELRKAKTTIVGLGSSNIATSSNFKTALKNALADWKSALDTYVNKAVGLVATQQKVSQSLNNKFIENSTGMVFLSVKRLDEYITFVKQINLQRVAPQTQEDLNKIRQAQLKVVTALSELKRLLNNDIATRYGAGSGLDKLDKNSRNN